MPTNFTPVKISELPDAGGLSDGDLIAIVQSGETRKISKVNFESQLTTPTTGTGPTVIEVVGSDEINVVAGKLLTHLVITGDEGETYAVGTTEGGGEILEESTIDSSEFTSYNLGYYFKNNTTVWLTGNFSARFYFQ